MPDITEHPLFNSAHDNGVAVIEACARIFAASLTRDTNASADERDKVAGNSVIAFLDTLSS